MFHNYYRIIICKTSYMEDLMPSGWVNSEQNTAQYQLYYAYWRDFRALFLSHLVRRTSVEEAGVIVDDASELGSVQEQHKEKEFLQNVL